MVMQFYARGKWRRYLGVRKQPMARKKIKHWRLLNKRRTKVLAKGGYSQVLKRMRQVEFFKRK